MQKKNKTRKTDTCPSNDVSSLFKDAVCLIDVDIEAALSNFNDGIRKSGHCIQRTVTVGKDKGSPWFDGECKNKRRLVRQCLRRYHKSNGTRGLLTQNKGKSTNACRKKKHSTKTRNVPVGVV